MATTDERREVAARLRKCIIFAKECDQNNEGEMIRENGNVMFRDIAEAVGGDYANFIDSYEETLTKLADLIEPEPINGETSDGYHTFNELYHHRALLFSVVVRNYPELCWKSKKHHAGDMYEGMFIVGINTPDGQASYHYDIEPYWDVFECEELEFAPEWDGSTPDQAIKRIGKLTRHEPEPEKTCRNINPVSCRNFICSKCDDSYEKGAGNPNPNFCPNCGAKVVG